MREPIFLTLAEVVAIHSDQIARYGGEVGVRDIALLESAIAQPKSTFGGQWLHKSLAEMAAAYAYHLCQNHPFYDGNKRAALASALVFLYLHDVKIKDPESHLISVMYAVAQGQLDKRGLTEEFKKMIGRV